MEPFDHDWWTRATCRAHYSHLENTSPTDRTVCSTTIIIFFTILLEFLAHSNEHSASWRGCTSRMSSYFESSASPTNPFIASSGESPSQDLRWTSSEQTSQSNKGRSHSWLVSAPRRLLLSVPLFLLVIMAFVIRMLDAAAIPELQEVCRAVVHPVPTDWPIVWLLTILPFISACSAFMHSAWNAVLARKGDTLSQESRLGRCFWLPALPFAVVMLFLAAFIAVVTIGVSKLRREVSVLVGNAGLKVTRSANDVEMQGGVAESLIRSNDEGVEDEDDSDVSGQRPPSYEQVHRGFARLEQGELAGDGKERTQK